MNTDGTYGVRNTDITAAKAKNDYAAVLRIHAEYGGWRDSVLAADLYAAAAEIKRLTDLLKTPTTCAAGAYPRVRPSVLRQQAAALNIMAALLGQGHPPDQADLRMAAMNCYAAADDLEDIKGNCKR